MHSDKRKAHPVKGGPVLLDQRGEVELLYAKICGMVPPQAYRRVSVVVPVSDRVRVRSAVVVPRYST